MPAPTSTQIEFKLMLPIRVSANVQVPSGYTWNGPFGLTGGLGNTLFPGTYRLVSNVTNWMIFADNLTPFSYANITQTFSYNTQYYNSLATPIFLGLNFANSSGAYGIVSLSVGTVSGTYTSTSQIAIMQGGQFGTCSVVIQPYEYYKFVNTVSTVGLQGNTLTTY